MATETGTATGFLDLYTKLVTFATTALGASNWVKVYGYELDDESVVGSPTLANQNVYSNKVILKGPGSGGADEIYIGIKTYYDPDVQKHTLLCQGFSSFDAAKVYDEQQLRSSPSCTYLWDQSMAYWFVGDGRRIIVIARMGVVYQIMYFGFMLPYATPADYPYPLLHGGCGNDRDKSFSSTTGNDFFINGRNGGGSLYSPHNSFLKTGNYDSGGSFNTSGDQSIYYLPYSAGYDVKHRLGFVREALDGCYVLTPIEILANGEYGITGILGVVDGLYQVSGFGNYSENVITIAAINYIVFQRVYRTGVDGFVALRWQ